MYTCTINSVDEIPPNAKEFDISLLVVIFRNICPNVPPPIPGWEINDPDENVISLAADLQRLKNIRNSVYETEIQQKLYDADFESFGLN